MATLSLISLRDIVEMESCSNCRFSLEEWKHLGEEPEYAEEYDADTFYCRR